MMPWLPSTDPLPPRPCTTKTTVPYWSVWAKKSWFSYRELWDCGFIFYHTLQKVGGAMPRFPPQTASNAFESQLEPKRGPGKRPLGAPSALLLLAHMVSPSSPEQLVHSELGDQDLNITEFTCPIFLLFLLRTQWSVESVEDGCSHVPWSNSIATVHSPQRRVTDLVLDTHPFSWPLITTEEVSALSSLRIAEPRAPTVRFWDPRDCVRLWGQGLCIAAWWAASAPGPGSC